MAETLTPKLVVFDLNKTLVKDNSWLNLNTAMGVTQEEDDMLGKWGSHGIISDQQGQDILCALYKKRSQPTRDKIREVVGAYEYYDGAKDAIKAVQDTGAEVALLSGSMDVMAHMVAADLGIQRWATNNIFHFNEVELLEKIETTMNEAEFKAVQLAKWCGELGIRSSQVAIVGDGASDLQLAVIAGFVVAIGKESELVPFADVVLGEDEYAKLPGCFSK